MKLSSIKKFKDVYVGIGLIIFSAFYIAISYEIPVLGDQVVKAGDFPRFLGGVLAVLSIYIALRDMKSKKSSDEGETAVYDKGKFIRVISTIAILILYLLFLRRIGFLIMSILYVFSQIIILTPSDIRNYKTTLIVSVLFPLAVYIIFLYGFKLMLPQGILNFM